MRVSCVYEGVRLNVGIYMCEWRGVFVNIHRYAVTQLLVIVRKVYSFHRKTTDKCRKSNFEAKICNVFLLLSKLNCCFSSKT